MSGILESYCFDPNLKIGKVMSWNNNSNNYNNYIIIITIIVVIIKSIVANASKGAITSTKS